MDKAGQMPYADALNAISVKKSWEGGAGIIWRPQGGKGFPHSHKSLINLSVNGVIQEGYFLDLYHKKSALDGVPDKVSMTLAVSGARILALDENGPSVHVNAVGKNFPFFMKRADHPHIHIPVPEHTSGYAEPIERMDIGELWIEFLQRANIAGAPPFTPPRDDADDSGQLGLL